MSFGLHDKDWVDPDLIPEYDGHCDQCMRYTACPCGCGLGYCDDSDGEMFQHVEEQRIYNESLGAEAARSEEEAVIAEREYARLRQANSRLRRKAGAPSKG